MFYIPSESKVSELAEMERICRPGGMVVVIWPEDPDWLCSQGFAHLSFDGEMFVSFASFDEAVELSRIFCPASARPVEHAKFLFVCWAFPPLETCAGKGCLFERGIRLISFS